MAKGGKSQNPLEQSKLYKRYVTSEEEDESEEQDDDVPPTPEQAQQQEIYSKQTFDWTEHIFRPDPPADTAARLELDPTNSVYTTTDRAMDHTSEDVGKYYQLNTDLVSRLPISRTISQRSREQPLGMEWTLTKEFLMIRKEAWELVQQLKASHGFAEEKENSLQGKTVAIMGRKGTGKTAAMNYLSQLALEAAWILIPTQGREFPTEKLGFILRNDARGGIFDQPRFAQEWFQWMHHVNQLAFSRVTLKCDYSEIDWHWTSDAQGDERTQRPEDDPSIQRTLVDMAELAARNPQYASILVHKFVEEMYALDPSEPPALVLIDDLNYWDSVSMFVDPATVKPLPSKKLAMVDAFSSFVDKPPPHGTTVFSLSPSTVMRTAPGHLAKADSVVEIPKYDNDEFVTALFHYQISNLLETSRAEMTPTFFAWTRGMTGRVPHEVLKLASIL